MRCKIVNLKTIGLPYMGEKIILLCYLWMSLQNIRVPKILIRLIKVCTEGSKGKIKIGNHLSKSFDINSGVRQSDGLSLLLFNLVLEKILQCVV